VQAVLQRGVLLYYGSRADAAREGRWRARKYLDHAAVSAPDREPALLLVSFSDGEQHRLAVPQQPEVTAARQVRVFRTTGPTLGANVNFFWTIYWVPSPDCLVV
jgi:hypothetical protein